MVMLKMRVEERHVQLTINNLVEGVLKSPGLDLVGKLNRDETTLFDDGLFIVGHGRLRRRKCPYFSAKGSSEARTFFVGNNHSFQRKTFCYNFNIKGQRRQRGRPLDRFVGRF